MSDELTIEQMRRLIAIDDCNRNGHSFDVNIAGSGIPLRVSCGRCWKSWKVEQNG